VATKKNAAFAVPKVLAQIPDLLHEIRERRLAMQKDVEALAKQEHQLEEELISKLPKSDATGISGQLYRCSIETKRKASVADWDKVYDYVIKNRAKGGFALLQRRISEAAVKEIWDAGREVPGVEPILIPTVSLVKR
jgi:hypothetical protein